MALVFRCDRCKEFEDTSNRRHKGTKFGTITAGRVSMVRDDDDDTNTHRSELCESCYSAVMTCLMNPPDKPKPVSG